MLILLFNSCSEHNITDGGNKTDGNFALHGGGGYYTDMGANQPSGDRYNEFEENPFVNVDEEAVSTFSIDADGASYANIRRFLNEGQRPPLNAVRTEELINYFDLDYPENASGHPITINGEVSTCPWQTGHKLIRIGIKGHSISKAELPPSNFVLLIDVSGSMSSNDKLNLLKEGFLRLTKEFSSRDRIAIVTYAGNAGIVLPSTAGDQKETIANAITSLGAGGSTAGAEGIKTAYDIARENQIKGGNNRIILGTDGDFNVGPSSQEELVAMIEEYRNLGIFLTVLGVGRGNLNDGMLEQIANKGNGTYEYIDNIAQADKVFIHEFSKFYAAAKDVKVQVEFNPGLVEAYRLIGHENRLLEEEDFEDDRKDAGEIGVGQNITALYEIRPGSQANFRMAPTFTIRFRYKMPDSDTSIPLDIGIFDQGLSFSKASEHMVLTASVAGFGMLLRNSEYAGTMTYQDILTWTDIQWNHDPQGRRLEFRTLVKKAGD